ncbi:MAG: hypothetical protein A2351_07415 [Omnitrophica bacterium RIFOXYB12_FULL_50_7]|nr:MAG: hypothetical protein A2351_07415 [Omnitrophica bacterium RIFOXYB12_FULL_50_7]
MAEKRNAAVFIMALIIACVWLPQNGFSEDERAGFYAGPLSVVVETLVEKAKSASDDAPEKLNQAKQQSRGETGVGKKRTSELENPLSSPS